MKLLKPLKTATTVMCDEKHPTVSVILPLQHMIENSMSPSEDDSSTLASMKRAIQTNLSSRYAEEHDYLLECIALDPRFPNLPHLEKELQDVYCRLKEKVLQFNQVFMYYYYYNYCYLLVFLKK